MSRRKRKSKSPSRRLRGRSASRSFHSRDGADGDAPSRIFVAHADCAKIIGRKGETRIEIERHSEASIKIQREEDMDGDKKERWVDIIGNVRQRRAALERILDVANYVRDEDGKVLKDGAAVPAPGAGDALVLQISCNEVGRVLGRGGETIGRLEDESRARLEIDKAEGRLTISGRPESIERAKELVLLEVSHCKLLDGTVLKDDGKPTGHGGGPPASGKEGFKLWVLGKEAGKVIGRGGETVREIMQRTGAEIQVERTETRDQGHAERAIQIFGTRAQLEEAFPLIIKDVTFARSELGLVKDPAMTPEEAADAARLRGPGGNAAFPFPGPPGAPPFFPVPGMPPPGMPGAPPPMMTMPPPPGMMPPLPGMPPGMPPGIPPPGMPPGGHLPPFPNGVPPHPGMPPPPAGQPRHPSRSRKGRRSRSNSSASSSGRKKKKSKKDKESTALANPKQPIGFPPPGLPGMPPMPPGMPGHVPPEFMGPPEHFPPGMHPAMQEEPIDWDDL